MKKLNYLLLLLAVAVAVNAQDTKKIKGKLSVPISIIIGADQASAANINASLYTDQILNELNKAQNVNFVLVDRDQNPELMIDINVADLKIGQRSQRSNNKTQTTSQTIGTNAQGLPLTRPAVLIIEEDIVERNSSATFSATIKAKNDSSFLAKKKFNSVYNYSKSTTTTPGNRLGSTKSSFAPKPMPEPKFEEFLLLLSKKDMTGYLAGELRKFYDTKSQTARIN